MKEFFKWLGVNEKIAKLVVWLLIIMVFLIVFNTGLESLGFPNYKITYENLITIDKKLSIEVISTIIICILNFYSVALLVFKLENYKKIFKYAVLYMIFNWIISYLLGYIAVQIFIIIYCIVFCYLYSNKNKKYILYGIISYITNVLTEGIMYYFKLSFIDVTKISRATRALLSIDYFIIIAVIILVKEIYLKKRGEKNELSRKYTLVGKVRQ